MLRASKLALAGWLWSALVLVACGSDDDDTPQERFAARYANAICPAISQCCEATGEPNDEAACRRFIGYLGAATTGKFNQAAADACLAGLEGWSCTEKEPDACDNVFSGSVPAGGDCETSIDCAAPVQGGVTCHYDYSGGSTAQGVCKIQPLPAEGQPCGAGASTETEYYVCDQDPASYCDAGTCKKKSALGQACSGYSSCAPGAYCASGTCVALAAVGEPCGSQGCVEQAYCDAGSCAKKKAMGEPCQSYDECQGSCDSSTGKCRPTATLCFSSD